MASIRFSGIGITEAVGSVGGTTFQRNGSGVFMKRRSKPGNGKSSAQVEQQVETSRIPGIWRGMSGDAKRQWNAAAASGDWQQKNRLGDGRNPTGYMLFSMLNLNLLNIDLTPIHDVPLKAETPAFKITQIDIDRTRSAIELTFLGEPDNFTLSLWASASISNGRSSYDNLRQFMSTWVNDKAVTFDAYYKKFGYPIVGADVFFEVWATYNGNGQKFLMGKYRSTVV